MSISKAPRCWTCWSHSGNVSVLDLRGDWDQSVSLGVPWTSLFPPFLLPFFPPPSFLSFLPPAPSLPPFPLSSSPSLSSSGGPTACGDVPLSPFPFSDFYSALLGCRTRAGAERGFLWRWQDRGRRKSQSLWNLLRPPGRLWTLCTSPSEKVVRAGSLQPWKLAAPGLSFNLPGMGSPGPPSSLSERTASAGAPCMPRKAQAHLNLVWK